jgi:hypothetical protein
VLEVRLVLGISLLALVVRLVFTFVAFPYIGESLGVGEQDDPNRFGQLAMNWVDGKGHVIHVGRVKGGPGYLLQVPTAASAGGRNWRAGAMACILSW